MPVGKDEAAEFLNRGGAFTSPQKLLDAGESTEITLLDISKHTGTKYPIKDKDYCYRVNLTKDGKPFLMDLAGKDAIAQVLRCLYPKGMEHPPEPCRVKLTRRTTRSKWQSEIEIARLGPPHQESDTVSF